MAEVSPDAILRKINDSTEGSYQENRINAANIEMNRLAGMVQSGDLDYADYMAVVNKVAPVIQKFIGSLYSGGSASAGAAQSAGAEGFINRFNTEYMVQRDAMQMIGQYLTPGEMATAQSAYMGPNGEVTGRSYVAQLAEMKKSSPEYLAGKAPEHTEDINRLIQGSLGRDGTPDEIEYFGSMLASGNTTSYEVGRFLQQTPEYIERQDQLFREGVSEEMVPIEEDVMRRGTEQALRRYTQMGTQHSPAMDFAVTKMLAEVAKQRTGYLTGLKVSQYGGQKEAARQDYASSLNKYLQDIDYERKSRQGMLGALTQRGWDAQDYATQSQDYQRWLNSQGGGGKRTGLGAGLGTLVGAGAGAALAPFTAGASVPMGMMIGGSLGGAAGGTYDYFS